jgi:imidazolonepropionase-like amidohydrolase
MADLVIDICDATVIDGSSESPRRNTSLRIVNDRITALWKGSERPAEAEAPADQTIDAANMTVMPGLIDAHCHISYGEGRSSEEVDVYGGAEWGTARALWASGRVLRAGVTGICDPGSTWMVACAARDAISNGMFPGPRIFAGGRHIAAEGGFADYFPSWLGMPESAEGVLCSSKEEMLREVRRQIKDRVDVVKISGDSQAQDRLRTAGSCFTDEELGAIVGMTHQLGRKAVIHARYAETVLAAIRAGVDWINHASYMRESDLGMLRDSGIAVCPTLTYTSNIVEWGDDVGVDPNYIETKKRELDALINIHSRALRLGVPMLVGSESGFSITPYGEWHAHELKLMVELLGMTPYQAIVAATAGNARIFGWDDVGTLEPGKRADILIVDGDPTQDIALLSKREAIAAVLKDGQPVALEAEQQPRRRMSHERGFNVSRGMLHYKAAVAGASTARH